MKASAIVLKCDERAAAGTYSCRYGFKTDQAECGDLVRLGGELYVEVDPPLNTTVALRRGDIIVVGFDHLSCLFRNDQSFFSMDDPRLISTAKSASPDAIEGVADTALEETAYNEGAAAEAEEVVPPPEGEEHAYSIFSHYRGMHGPHVDFCAKGDTWVLMAMNSGSLCDPVATMGQARTFDASDNFKVDLESGRFKRKDDGRAFALMSSQVEPFEAGLKHMVDEGVVEFGAMRPHFREYFLSGRWGGRLLFRKLSPKRAYKSSTACYWTCVQPDDQTPYVLSSEAVRKDWLPPAGFSALPSVMRETIPPGLHYWETESKEEALALRKELVAGEKGVRQIFGSTGGKKFLVPEILPRIPEHTTYVETFAGGAAIFFAKEPSPREVLNDINEEAMQAYQVIKEMDDAVKARLERMDFSYSRVNFDWARTYKGGDPLERFRRWIFMTHMTYGGRTDRGGAKPSFRILGKGWAGISRLDQLHERLKDVVLRCVDYKEVLKEFDSPSTFFYLDPPYTGHAERDIGHVPMMELAKAVKGLSGKWLISCMDNERNRSLFDGYTIEVVHRGSFGMADRQSGEERRKNVEIVISNYGKKEVTMEFAVKDVVERIVGGPVYPAEEVDSQKEWASFDAIQTAMYEFMEYHRAFNVGHGSEDVEVVVLECFQAEKDTEKGGGSVRRGTWWLTVRVIDEQTWQRIESGELRGFSWEGLKALRGGPQHGTGG